MSAQPAALVAKDLTKTYDDLVAIAVPDADGVWKLDTVMPAVPVKDDPSCA